MENHFFAAYKKRRSQVSTHLKALASELTAQGCRVFIPKGEQNITWLTALVTAKNKAVYIQFAECPYSWQFHCYLDPAKRGGSSQVIKITPFDEKPVLGDLLELARPLWCSQEKFLERKLSYLEEWPNQTTDNTNSSL